MFFRTSDNQLVVIDITATAKLHGKVKILRKGMRMIKRHITNIAKKTGLSAHYNGTLFYSTLDTTIIHTIYI